MLKRLVVFCLLFVTVSYGAFCLFIYQQQRVIQHNVIQLKFTPEQTGLTDYEYANVLTEDGIQLVGWYVPAKDGNKTIVFFHGNGQIIGTSTGGVSYFIGLGYGVLFAEYREYAGHAGKVTEEGLYLDANAYVEWLLNSKNLQQKDLIFYGESLGTALALKMAKSYDGAAVVLLAPFSSILDTAKKHYWYLPVDLMLKDTFFNDRLISSVDEPILMIHGDEDRVVPIEYGRKLYNIAPNGTEFVTVAGGNHSNLYKVGALNHIERFLEGL